MSAKRSSPGLLSKVALFFRQSDSAQTDALASQPSRSIKALSEQPGVSDSVPTDWPTQSTPEHEQADIDLDFSYLAAQTDESQTLSWRSAVPADPASDAKGVHSEVPGPAVVAQPQPGPVERGLQQAAVLIAEGRGDAAAAALLDLFLDDALKPEEADVLACALFDLYRSTGPKENFDRVAMDYAQRFGRSPAEWFSVPEMLAKRSAGVSAPAGHASMPQARVVWQCPEVLDRQALAGLKAAFAAPDTPWLLDWGPLTQIDAQAATDLSDLFSHWQSRPVELQWIGAPALVQALQARTPSGDKQADPLWWHLRLDALSMLQRRDEFEALALDFCLVYEVSPPDWKVTPCNVVHEIATDANRAPAESSGVFSAGEPLEVAADVAHCELAGELVGESMPALEKLQIASKAAPNVVVACALLVRVDPVAAGAIRNWAADCASAGIHVQLVRVPYLVALFLRKMGLDRYADISVRPQLT